MNLTIVIVACPGCCLKCHDLWGDTLPIVLVPPTSCGCYTPILLGPSFIATITGVSGMFTAVWVPANSDWEVVVGSISTQQYSDTDVCTVPDGAPVVTDALLTIACDPDTGILSVQIGGIFISGGVIDAPMANDFTCDGGKPAHGGTVTVNAP